MTDTLPDSQHKLLLKIAEEADDFVAVGDARDAEATWAADLARSGFVQLEVVPNASGATLRAKITAKGRAHLWLNNPTDAH